LAQDGKIVDAIRTLEELVAGENIDPYDLVMMGDLCIRGGQAGDATGYYQRAVAAYRDSALNRNGIALCRKVLRAQPQEKSFVLMLAELCEREGLVLDAVSSYLDYADGLDPTTSTGNEPWLASLSRLRPRSADVVTRQAEQLVRWSRLREAVSLLRHGAEIASSEKDRSALTDMASQVAALGKTGDAGFDAELEAFMDTDMAAPTTHSTALRAPSVQELAEISMPDPGPMVLDGDAVLANGTGGHGQDLVLDPSLLDGSRRPLELALPGDEFRRSPPASESLVEPTPTPLPRQTFGDLDEAVLSPLRPSGPPALPGDADALQHVLEQDPTRIDAMEKLLECHELDGDILAAQEVRERLAQALLKHGDAEAALAVYEAYLKVEPTSRSVREQYERLARQLGRTIEPRTAAVADAPASSAGPKPSSLFNVRGLSSVEVRDDKSGVSADDMVDLGALLDEFREGLKSTMATADPRAHYDMGLSHFEMGLYEEAADAFESASHDPQFEPEAREMWGRCLRELGKFDDAVRVLRAGLALRPESLGVRYQLARALEGLGESEEAGRFYGSILREDPNFEDSAARLRALGGSDCVTRPPTVSS
jgi:tetratricopeptide (TPR) repeat protein